MKKVMTLLFLMSMVSIFGQTIDDRNCDVTELDTIFVSGTAIVFETDSTNAKYYLDEDGDGLADYHLNFGPIWYYPDSSEAVRPLNGESISILGGLQDSSMIDETTIIVYEINDLFWRDPFFAEWNNLGSKDFKKRDKKNARSSYGFGWEHDSLTYLTATGTTLIDTTFYMNHYYLDTDADGLPNYALNFGPYWFNPESGATRPGEGQTINVVGGMLETTLPEPMIVVYELDGLLWRDSSSIGNHFGGGWLDANCDSTTTFHSPFDNGDQIKLHSGWNNVGSGMHDGDSTRLPDSLFCQMFEIAPENVLNRNQLNVFASYEFNMLKSDGTNMLMDENRVSKSVKLANNAEYKFHYTDSQIALYNGDESTIVVQSWDDATETWTSIDATVDTDENTVTYSTSTISNIVVLSALGLTDIHDNNTDIPTEFTLLQNYPNPFNPSTKIAFTLSYSSQIVLNVYNIVGEKVATLVNEHMNAGAYTINFNASNLSSGVYLYKLKSRASRIVKKMSLLK